MRVRGWVCTGQGWATFPEHELYVPETSASRLGYALWWILGLRNAGVTSSDPAGAEVM